MNIALVNLGTVPVPFSSSQDKGFVQMLEPGKPLVFDSKATTIVNVGDNPSATEEFMEGVRSVFEKLANLLAFWREHATPHEGGEAEAITVSIVNRGTHGLRVLLGSNTNEVQVSPGAVYEATAAEYVEIRELGV